MTGPEHFWEAERLLKAAERGRDDKGPLDKAQALRAAGVHATLALAAATALQSPGTEDGGMLVGDLEQWETACALDGGRAGAP
jgi:hypothetical protein